MKLSLSADGGRDGLGSNGVALPTRRVQYGDGADEPGNGAVAMRARGDTAGDSGNPAGQCGWHTTTRLAGTKDGRAVHRVTQRVGGVDTYACTAGHVEHQLRQRDSARCAAGTVGNPTPTRWRPLRQPVRELCEFLDSARFANYWLDNGQPTAPRVRAQRNGGVHPTADG